MFIGNLARTKTPARQRVKGSKVNKPGSAASGNNKITFSDPVNKSINTIIKGSKVSKRTARAVVRRGFGAYSVSHRPGITRTAWGLARLKAFVKKSKGLPVKSAYIQDDDLL